MERTNQFKETYSNAFKRKQDEKMKQRSTRSSGNESVPVTPVKFRSLAMSSSDESPIHTPRQLDVNKACDSPEMLERKTPESNLDHYHACDTESMNRSISPDNEYDLPEVCGFPH